MPRLDTEALFEPFFRPQSSMKHSGAGTGLGPAICKAIAVTNGRVLSLSQDTDGVLVTVRFTASAAPESRA